ncbi:hypothetical protein JNK13_05220 [bacterium]|nr:hypothetical protein [bacterium]
MFIKAHIYKIVSVAVCILAFVWGYRGEAISTYLSENFKTTAGKNLPDAAVTAPAAAISSDPTSSDEPQASAFATPSAQLPARMQAAQSGAAPNPVQTGSPYDQLAAPAGPNLPAGQAPNNATTASAISTPTFGGTMDAITQDRVGQAQIKQRALYFEKLSEQMKQMQGNPQAQPANKKQDQKDGAAKPAINSGEGKSGNNHPAVNDANSNNSDATSDDSDATEPDKEEDDASMDELEDALDELDTAP